MPAVLIMLLRVADNLYWIRAIWSGRAPARCRLNLHQMLTRARIGGGRWQRVYAALDCPARDTRTIFHIPLAAFDLSNDVSSVPMWACARTVQVREHTARIWTSHPLFCTQRTKMTHWQSSLTNFFRR